MNLWKVNEMANNDKNEVIAEVIDWITSRGGKEMHPYMCDGLFSDENKEDDFDLVAANGDDVAVEAQVIPLLVAVALGVDEKVLGEMAIAYDWNFSTFSALRMMTTSFELLGKRVSQTDLAIAQIKGLEVCGAKFRFDAVENFSPDPEREIGLTHTNSPESWLDSRLRGLSSFEDEDPTNLGHEVPYRIRSVDHLPGRSLSTLVQRLGGFSDDVIKHKVERYSQMEAMIASFFWAKIEAPETVALRQAFIDLAEGPFRSKFLQALGALTASHAETPDELLIGLLNLKKMAGEGSAVYQALEDPVVVANTECILTDTLSEAFRIKLLGRLAAFDQASFGVAQVEAIRFIGDDLLSTHVDQTKKLVAHMAYCLKNLVDGLNTPEDEASQPQKPKSVIDNLLYRKEVIVKVFVDLINLPAFDLTTLSELSSGQQACLALSGVNMKHLKKVPLDVKGKVLMNELGM